MGGVTASDDATLASEEAGNVKSRLLGPSHVKRTNKINPAISGPECTR